MGWDRRIRDDELVVRPQQPRHIEVLYLVSKPSAIKLWVAVDTKDRPFLITCTYVMKPLRYDPPLVPLISQLLRLPLHKSLHLKNRKRTTEKSLLG